MNTVTCLIQKYNKLENCVLKHEKARFTTFRQKYTIDNLLDLWADCHEYFCMSDFNDIVSFFDVNSLKDQIWLLSNLTEPKVIYNVLPWNQPEKLLELLEFSPSCENKAQGWMVAPLVLQVLFHCILNNTELDSHHIGKRVGQILVKREDCIKLSLNFFVLIADKLQLITLENLCDVIKKFINGIVCGIGCKRDDLLDYIKTELEKNVTNQARIFSLLKSYSMMSIDETMDDIVIQQLDNILVHEPQFFYTSVYTRPIPNYLHKLISKFYKMNENTEKLWSRSITKLISQLQSIRFANHSDCANIFNSINFMLAVGVAIIDNAKEERNKSVCNSILESLWKIAKRLSILYADAFECDFVYFILPLIFKYLCINKVCKINNESVGLLQKLEPKMVIGCIASLIPNEELSKSIFDILNPDNKAIILSSARFLLDSKEKKYSFNTNDCEYFRKIISCF